jgi:peptide subunit release factor RF-3
MSELFFHSPDTVRAEVEARRERMLSDARRAREVRAVRSGPEGEDHTLVEALFAVAHAITRTAGHVRARRHA